MRNQALPPKEVQIAAAKDCVAVDADRNASEARMVSAENDLVNAIAAIYSSSAPRVEIDKIFTNVHYGLNEAMNEVSVTRFFA